VDLMPAMSPVEAAWCRSAPWRAFASRVVLPWALQGVGPVGHALEIGGGSGAMAAAILDKHPALRMTVTDFDPTMVDAAAQRLAAFGERATVRQADATALPFADATFDTVASFIMLHHTVQWETALAEATRVLKPGGWLVGYDLLATRVLHRVHRGEGAHRMIERHQLDPVLAALPLVDRRVRVGAGGFLVRFAARRGR
jgi:ubiquinone/menaquinone biosynthesis C-methylase UbiE